MPVNVKTLILATEEIVAADICREETSRSRYMPYSFSGALLLITAHSFVFLFLSNKTALHSAKMRMLTDFSWRFPNTMQQHGYVLLLALKSQLFLLICEYVTKKTYELRKIRQLSLTITFRLVLH